MMTLKLIAKTAWGFGILAVGIILFVGFLRRDFGAAGLFDMARHGRIDPIQSLVALVTILSGLWLYWHVSGGFQEWYMTSATGSAIALGAASAIVAFGFGVGVMRPAVKRAAALSQGAAGEGAGPDDARMKEAQALRVRAANIGRVVAVLLAIAVVCMAVARYL